MKGVLVMNKLYLMMDEKKDYALFKVGFASNIFQRIVAYSTHNAGATLINTVNTKATSKHQLEKKCHAEIIARGYKFAVSPLTHSTTEWFAVSYDDPFYKELKTFGFEALKTTARHKIHNLEG
jgi:hypothetical protein